METVKIYKLEAIDTIVQNDGSVIEEYYILGFFDSKKLYEKMVMKYRKLPGFCLDSCKFYQIEYTFCNIKDEVKFVFYVSQTTEGIEVAEEVVEIGVFLSEKEAAIAKSEYESSIATNNGENKQVFVERYIVNKPEWQEGFERYTWYE